jgi:F-type H+-transporting ATPase subunit delta
VSDARNMVDPVTNRYVEALFNLGVQRGALAAIERDVERLSAELAKPGVGDFFFDARVSIEVRRAKLEPLLAGAHELTRNFVNLLFDKRREDVLRRVGAAFHARSLRERGEVEGVALSARPLGDAAVARLATALGGRLGKTVRLKNEIRPELVGGVRVIVASRMLDSSVQGRLAGLKKRMEEAPLPSAAG